AFLIARDDLRGPFNVTAPQPVTNAQFSVALAKELHRPCLTILPATLIRAALGEMGQELLLASKRVLPMRLEAAGFRFIRETISAELAASLNLKRALPFEEENPAPPLIRAA
ncbi:MAG: DUF1731 domain-containing protein, partial [Rhodospirillaceae bacterium]|nr:DUF1731 domain-containing protein [Rhodospirillaceae bacterium]